MAHLEQVEKHELEVRRRTMMWAACLAVAIVIVAFAVMVSIGWIAT
jgi:hypothetical protein